MTILPDADSEMTSASRVDALVVDSYVDLIAHEAEISAASMHCRMAGISS